jgi:hypothetical protein
MRNFKLLLPLFLCCWINGSAQLDEPAPVGKRRGEYGLVAYVGGGAGYYFNVAGVPDYLNPRISSFSPMTSLRIMWHPDHLVRVGLETGKMQFLSYSFKDSVGNDGKVMVTAVPLLVEWSMAVTKRIHAYAGSGVYFLTSKLDYAGEARSKKLSIGWMAAISYIHPVNNVLGIGTELKWMDAAETTDGSLGLQVQLVWKFLKW